MLITFFKVRNRFRMEEIRLYDSPFKELADQVHLERFKSWFERHTSAVQTIFGDTYHSRNPPLQNYFLLPAGHIVHKRHLVTEKNMTKIYLEFQEVWYNLYRNLPDDS